MKQVLIILCVFAIQPLWSQSNWQLRLLFSKNEMLPTDFISYKCIIKNTTEKEQLFYDVPSRLFGISLEYLDEKTSKWISISGLEGNNRCGSVKPINVKPQEEISTVSKTFMFLDKLSSIDKMKIILVGKKNLMLRANFYSNKVRVYSEPVALKILNEPNASTEKEAYQWLKGSENPYFIHILSYSNFRINENNYELYKKQASYLLEKYPNSSYVSWANAVLASCLLYELQNGKSKRIQNDLSTIKKIIDELDLLFKERSTKEKKYDFGPYSTIAEQSLDDTRPLYLITLKIKNILKNYQEHEK